MAQEIEKYNFIALVNEVQIPVVCRVDENGHPQDLQSSEDDEHALFDNFKYLSLKVRRKDQHGFEREHDARMCASRIGDNGNADLRIELSDVFLTLNVLCRACAFISLKYKNNVPISYTNDEVVAYAISTYI